MDYRRFGNQIVLRVDRDEEVMTEIVTLCEKEQIRLASISGLGAADHLVMGLYDVEAQKFTETVLDQPLEITSIIGSVTEMDGKPYLHVHITVADVDGHAGGDSVPCGYLYAAACGAVWALPCADEGRDENDRWTQMGWRTYTAGELSRAARHHGGSSKHPSG